MWEPTWQPTWQTTWEPRVPMGCHGMPWAAIAAPMGCHGMPWDANKCTKSSKMITNRQITACSRDGITCSRDGKLCYTDALSTISCFFNALLATWAIWVAT